MGNGEKWEPSLFAILSVSSLLPFTSTGWNEILIQFFICFDDTPHLDGQYTVWGEVIEGMEFVDMIKKGDPIKNGMVDDPDKIIKMWIE